MAALSPLATPGLLLLSVAAMLDQVSSAEIVHAIT
jgi:hypothetical protein